LRGSFAGITRYEDWEHVDEDVEGDRFRDVSKEHRSFAVLKADIDICVGWGLEPTSGHRQWTLFKENQVSNRSLSLQLGDVFYRGAIVRRYELLEVDPQNGILQSPTGVRLKNGLSWGDPHTPLPRRCPARSRPAVAGRRQPQTLGHYPSARRHQPSTTIRRWTLS